MTRFRQSDAVGRKSSMRHFIFTGPATNPNPQRAGVAAIGKAAGVKVATDPRGGKITLTDSGAKEIPPQTGSAVGLRK
jgi:hypothetical protein